MQKSQLEAAAASAGCAADDAGHVCTHCHLLMETMLVLAWEWQTCSGLCRGTHYHQQPLTGLEHLACAGMTHQGGLGLHVHCFGLCCC